VSPEGDIKDGLSKDEDARPVGDLPPLVGRAVAFAGEFRGQRGADAGVLRGATQFISADYVPRNMIGDLFATPPKNSKALT
jgi:hypothetical protein